MRPCLSFAIVASFVVLLLGIPLNIGTEAWEIRAICMTFEGLPLGLALIGTGAIGRTLRFPRRIPAVLLAVLAFGLPCIFLLDLLDMSFALRDVQEQVKRALEQGITKTMVG